MRALFVLSIKQFSALLTVPGCAFVRPDDLTKLLARVHTEYSLALFYFFCLTKTNEIKAGS